MKTFINDTKLAYDKQKTIHQLIEEQVIRSSANVAAIHHNDQITYRELNEKANQIAWMLREDGVKANDIIGLMVTRSFDMLTGILGILKAGGCYLPLDPKFPQFRIAYMLEDSGARILLTQSSLVPEYDGTVICLDEKLTERRDNPFNINDSSDLAYVIYTSGSTGNPKGVMIEHRNIHNFIEGMKKVISFRRDKVMLSLTTISFDIFVLESLLPMSLGMGIVIADPLTFAEDIVGQTYHMLQMTPSTAQMILKDKRNHMLLDGITDIMLGGEPFPERLLKKLKTIASIRDAKIYNLYGPTETTVWSTVKDLTDTDKVTIGKPIANTQIYIMNEKHKSLPFGEIGEICIAGDGVVRGYFGRPQLTEEKFITDAIEEDIRIYCTGDLGRWLPNGELECFGRIDSQVKIRGFRIELGEIETALMKVGGVNDCVVAAKENEHGEKYLAAYYVSGQLLNVSELINCLKEQLPEYEIPGIYMKIDKVPLTSNGKVDRLVLPEPKFKRPNLHTPYIEPKTDKHKKLAKIWKQILNYDRISIKDNFFDLGGNSILVSQLHMELEKEYEISLDITVLFTSVTIEEQSLIIERDEVNKKPFIFRFPDSWYTDSNAHRMAELSTEVDTEVFSKIVNFAKSAGTEPEFVYLSAYLYLLGKIIKTQAEIGILCFVEREYAYSLRLSLPVTDDLTELCKELSRKKPENKLKISQIKYFIKIDSRDIMLTYQYGIEEPLGEHDLRLEIKETRLTLRFLGERLKEEKVSGLMARYKGLIQAIAEQAGYKGGNNYC